jgi:hypothetical protein
MATRKKEKAIVPGGGSAHAQRHRADAFVTNRNKPNGMT